MFISNWILQRLLKFNNSGRSVGLELTIDDFQKVSDEVPFLADLKPSGKYVMEDVHKVWTMFMASVHIILMRGLAETIFLP